MKRTFTLLSFSVACLALFAQQPQLFFEEDFEDANGQATISPGWIWDGGAPSFIQGCAGDQALSKELSGDWSPNEVRADWLFHPLPYDPLLQYQVRARVWVDQGDWSDPRTVFIGFGWYVEGADDPFGSISQANTQQESCPFQDLWSVMFPMPEGPPGAVFGLVVHTWTDFPTQLFLDDVKVYTLPYRARFTGRLFLEGPYDPDTQVMQDDLRVDGLIPLVEPYTALGFPQVAGGGGETVTQAVLDGVYAGGRVVDWVRLELRDWNDNTTIVATRQALLLQDGSVVSTDPLLAPLFGVRPGSYWISVRHRNHLGCMTASPRTLPYPGGGGIWIHDFTQSMTTWGTEAMKNVEGRTVLWAGNALPDAELKYAGNGNDRDAVLDAIGGSTPTSSVSGYRVEDVTMDGLVKYTGSKNDRDPILVNIGGTTPTNVRLGQLP